MLKLFAGTVFGLFLFSSTAMAQCTSYPNTLTNGTTADATQVMANFNCAALTSGATLTSPALTGTVSLPGSSIFNSSGIMGIGTTSPSGTGIALAVNGKAVINGTNVASGTSTDTMLAIQGTPAAISFGGANAAARIEAVNGGGTSLTFVSGWHNFSSGNVGIGVTSPGYTLQLAGTGAATGGFINISDLRLKKDVQSLRGGALADVMQLRPVTFLWKKPSDVNTSGTQVGFVAQEVEKILPLAVKTGTDFLKTKGLQYNHLVAVLTKAVQEQQAEIVALRAANDNKSAEMISLRTQINAIERRIGMRTAQR